MSDNTDLMGHLPVNWETRQDLKNRRQYFIDTNTKITTQYEELHPRHKSLFQHSYYRSPSRSSQQDTTVLQHGSLEFCGYNSVYPSYSYYPPFPQPAFQILSAPPVSHMAPNSTYCKEITEQSRPSPILNRALGTVMGATAFQQRSHHYMDTSLFGNTDELVAKIGATFPTVSETHIRCLLKKYHNREAVVISALQVEKYPIATPGPFSTPLLGRNSYMPGNYTPFQVTPPVSIRGTPSISIRSNMATPPVTIRGSIGTPPLGIRGSPPTRGSSPVTRPGSGSSYYSFPAFEYKQSPRSQTSPKMKLRYLKSIFPKVEEVVLLDTLASENNNVMKTAEKLKVMGFEKKESSKSLEKKKQEQSAAVKVVQSLIKKEEVETHKPTPPPRLKSLEEKSKMKVRLAGLYSDIPEKLIQIAIESVDFDEEKARHLLMLLVNEENENKKDFAKKAVTKSVEFPNEVSKIIKDSKIKETQTAKKSDEIKKEGVEKKAKPKKDVPKISRGTSTTEDKEFKSLYMTKAKGRNKELRKGPNDQLLLPDYLTWNGPNPELRGGKKKGLAEGPNKNLLMENNKIAKGPNKENWKGPTLNLAKGSIYSRITMSLFGNSRVQ